MVIGWVVATKQQFPFSPFYNYSTVHLIQTPGTYQIGSNYEIALNIKCKYNGLSRDHNHLSELTGFLNEQSLN